MGKQTSGLFQPTFLGSHTPCLPLQNQQRPVGFFSLPITLTLLQHPLSSLTLTLLPPSFTYKSPVITGSQIIQDDLPISRSDGQQHEFHLQLNSPVPFAGVAIKASRKGGASSSPELHSIERSLQQRLVSS